MSVLRNKSGEVLGTFPGGADAAIEAAPGGISWRLIDDQPFERNGYIDKPPYGRTEPDYTIRQE
jgi:hypothetical protein